VARETLPHKVWSDCVNCPKFPDCDETAVAIQVERRRKAK
jgi:amino-acid N-acetyltransferase